MRKAFSTDEANDVAEPKPIKNPYVGPRAFKRKEAIYGRDREAEELSDLLISERIVLLHAPSGAGKTSLVQAGVVPILEKEGFAVSVPLRVNTPPPESGADNPYIYSVNLSLLGDQAANWPDLPHTRLATVLEAVERSEQAGRPRDPVLFFDQFEEILTLDLAGNNQRSEFFRQLSKALSETHRWALFAIREDFLGGLDRYRARMPTHFRSTMRLDYLERPAALHAMIEPARKAGVRFTPEAAEWLFDRLAVAEVDRGDRREQVVGAGIEPVQLQTVCLQLWRDLFEDRKHPPEKIEQADVAKTVDVEKYLARFYSTTLDRVVRKTGANMLAVRFWFDSDLITRDGWRSQTRTGPRDAGVEPAVLLRELERRYLIRSDVRAGTQWYELAHDRLVRPVRADNREWLRENKPLVGRATYVWLQSNKDRTWLLRGRELAEARRWLRNNPGAASEPEVEFVNASVRQARHDNRFRGALTATVALSLIAVVELILLILFALNLLPSLR
jgi:hypothetical protein